MACVAACSIVECGSCDREFNCFSAPKYIQIALMLQLRSRLVVLVTAAFFVPARVVMACEGDCIVGITNALLGNYTTPLNKAFTEIVSIYSSVVFPADVFFLLGERNPFRNHWVKRLKVYILPRPPTR